MTNKIEWQLLVGEILAIPVNKLYNVIIMQNINIDYGNMISVCLNNIIKSNTN